MAKKPVVRNYLALKHADDHLDFGRLVAETDGNLAYYYVSDRYVRRALNVDDQAIFFIGPKGIGKSAILKMVAIEKKSEEARVISMGPDDLAFSALANAEATSPLLTDASKNQWVFKSLWDYALSLEVIKREYPDRGAVSNFLERLFGDNYPKVARQLVELSQKDGISLSERILQLINEVEISGEYLGGKVSAKVALDPDRSIAAGKYPLLSLVNTVTKRLADRLKHTYYILIDDLDRHWSDSPHKTRFSPLCSSAFVICVDRPT